MMRSSNGNSARASLSPDLAVFQYVVYVFHGFKVCRQSSVLMISISEWIDEARNVSDVGVIKQRIT